MAKINEIINLLQDVAPIETQEKWDNSGWQVRLRKNYIKKIMLCITVTNEVLMQAKNKNCDMIIAHHPIFFDGDFDKEITINLVKEHLPVYSIHTPLDKAINGTTDSLIKACGMQSDEILNEYTKIVYADINEKEFVSKVKKGLNVDNLRITNYEPQKNIKKIAFCAGSGTSFCKEVENAGCDCFVTADLKYHTALDFSGTIIDVGHLESEKPTLKLIKNKLNNVECIIAYEESPIKII